jgi:hypothetical protein
MITQNMYKCYHFSQSAIVMLSFSIVHILCYHLMLSFFTVSKCYHFYVIIFPCTYFVLSLCYHLMLT